MLDTCFLIDYQREAGKGIRGPIAKFLNQNLTAKFELSTIAWGEFIAGFPSENDPFIEFVRDKVEFRQVNEEAAIAYRRVFRRLESRGRLIGANDLWIAAVALSTQRPLVTRNGSDFERIPDLQLVSY